MKNLLDYQTDFIQDLNLKGKSFNTVKNYKADLNCFNKFLLEKSASTVLTEFTDTQVQEYSRFIDEKYNSPNSKRRRVQALRIFFDFLVERGHYPENPIKKIVVAPKVLDKPAPNAYDEVLGLRNYLNEKILNASGIEKLLYIRNKILMHLIYGAGLKVSDIAVLKNANILMKSDTYRVLVAHPKRDPYTVALPIGFQKTYDEYRALLEEQKNKDRIDFDNLLFNANPFKILSGGLSARGIELIFKEISESTGTKITPKSLRQSCIFKWLCLNHPEASVKEWMGVQPIYSLKPYTSLLKEDPAKFCFLELTEDE